MPHVCIDGIATRYSVLGSGPPLLMFSPGGFDARIEKWSELGQYARLGLLETLPAHFTCILFDRRECGESGGRIERVTPRHYVEQAKGLLDHLRICSAHVAGGCLGCSWATAFAIAYPQATRSLFLHWPVGGPKYRVASQRRFTDHLAFLRTHGLDGVVELGRLGETTFAADSRAGPWASVIPRDPDLARELRRIKVERYAAIVTGMARSLVDRDTVPGVDPLDAALVDRPALIIAGDDAAHARSAAHVLHECLPAAQLCDIPVGGQSAELIGQLALRFLLDAPG